MLSNSEFSIKFETIVRRPNNPNCVPGDCPVCDGTGKQSELDKSDMEWKFTGASCLLCKGTGQTKCYETVTKFKQLAMLKFTGDKFSVEIVK